MAIKLTLHDPLFDSCRLRHRQDAELESQPGPFEMMGLISEIQG
jgi:hypothetical protein